MRRDQTNSDDGMSSLISFFLKSALSSAKETLLQSVDDLLSLVQQNILSLQKRLLRNMIVAICAVTSIISLIISLCFYLTDILNWQRYAVFMLSGIILLTIGVVVSIINKRV